MTKVIVDGLIDAVRGTEATEVVGGVAVGGHGEGAEVMGVEVADGEAMGVEGVEGEMEGVEVVEEGASE
jgi:hypothetical protein